MQVLLRAMLVDALHAALEDAEVALDRIGMNGTINVLADAVSDPTVRLESLADALVLARLIGHKLAFPGNVPVHYWADFPGLGGVDRERPHLAAALHQRQYSHLMRRAAAHFGSLLSSNKGLIGFYDPAFAAKGYAEASGAHGLADAVRHEPSGFESHAKGTVKLVGADAFLAGTHHVNDLEP